MMCPSCNQLVGVNDEACYSCGRKRPGLFGFAAALGGLKLDDVLVPLILWGCGALFLATLVSSGEAIRMEGLMSFLAPSSASLILFGGSGAYPVVGLGRWWTFLSAGWLHGSLIHILFNMMSVRDLVPQVASLYGPARTVIIYVLSSAAGFMFSTAAGYLTLFVPFLGGGTLTIGASAAVFGLLGSLFYYGRRGGSGMIREAAKGWILSGILFGFMMPGIDNWAHLGGLVGGYFCSWWLDPMHPERGDHMVIALICLALSVAAVLASILTLRSHLV
jgi:rhomboid protease GluP